MSRDLPAYTAMTASKNLASNPYTEEYIPRTDSAEVARAEAFLRSEGAGLGEPLYDEATTADDQDMINDLVGGMTEPVTFGRNDD